MCDGAAVGRNLHPDEQGSRSLGQPAALIPLLAPHVAGAAMSVLVRYEQARAALAECARIDEASDIRDKAAALAAYARQSDDRELEVWVREIHLRACVRIGELSRAIETTVRRRDDAGRLLPSGEKQGTTCCSTARIASAAAGFCSAWRRWHRRRADLPLAFNSNQQRTTHDWT